MADHDARLTAYLDGARAFNNQQSIRDNPHNAESGVADAWEKGFARRRDEVRAARRAAALADAGE